MGCEKSYYKTQGFRGELQVSGGRGTRLGSRQRQVRGKTRKRQGQGKGWGGGPREVGGAVREWEGTGKFDKIRLLQALKSLVVVVVGGG